MTAAARPTWLVGAQFIIPERPVVVASVQLAASGSGNLVVREKHFELVRV